MQKWRGREESREDEEQIEESRRLSYLTELSGARQLRHPRREPAAGVVERARDVRREQGGRGSGELEADGRRGGSCCVGHRSAALTFRAGRRSAVLALHAGRRHDALTLHGPWP
jgi:hypothetical protein